MQRLLRRYAGEDGPQLLYLMPACLALGMAIYYALPNEPSLNAGFAIPLLLSLCWLLRRRAARYFAIALLFGVTGFFLATWHSWRNPAILLHKDLRYTEFTGTIEDIAYLPGGGMRLLLAGPRIEKLKPEETPGKIRVNLRQKDFTGTLGDRVALRGGLMPPSAPVMPGGYDFARHFYFQQIGAVGYALPPARILPREVDRSAIGEFRRALAENRTRINRYFLENMREPAGAIAAGLVTGDQSAIPEKLAETIRYANLAHVLAISGLHMILVSGFVFAGIRGALILLPWTRHWPYTKELAALAALIASGAYLMISVFPPSAIRAYIMIAFVLIGILLRREVVPLHSLIWAAGLIIIFDLPSLLSPSFQLSFAATLGLIAFFDLWTAFLNRHQVKDRLFDSAIAFLFSVMLTTLIAEIAVAPFVLYHFNMLSIYGVIANLLVVPLSTFLIMPALIFVVLCYPVGLDFIPLAIAEWGIGLMVDIAEWVTSFPGSVRYLPSLPGWGLALAAAGGFWWCITRARWRWAGLAFYVIGMCGLLTYRMPDLLISYDGKSAAAQSPNGPVLLRGKPDGFVETLWANGSGYAELPRNETIPCDKLGCLIIAGKKRIALSFNPASLMEDCRRADIVYGLYFTRYRCEAKLITMRDIYASGSQYLENEIPGNAAQLQGKRPWTRYSIVTPSNDGVWGGKH